MRATYRRPHGTEQFLALPTFFPCGLDTGSPLPHCTGMVAGRRSAVLGLALLGFVTGSTRSAGAQAGDRPLPVQVNIPYVVQFGFGSYEVGGLSVGA